MAAQTSTPVSQRRLRVGIAMALTLLVILAGRLVFIQGVDAAGNAEKAMNQRLRPVELAPERGSILDTEGRVLAESVQRYDLVVDQRLVKDYTVWNNEKGGFDDVELDDALAELSEVLNIEVSELRALMVGDRPYRVVTRNVTPAVKNDAMAIKIPGLISQQVSERTYPNGAIAGSILGFLGSEGEPLEGLELSQNEHLTGTAGERLFEISADGVRIPNASFSETPAVNGQDLQLTIDQDVQWFAQEAIAAKADEYNAEWAAMTVLEAKTGDIVAMADSTTVDPAQPNETDSKFWRPLSVTQAFEPGSTGKIPTFAMALEEGSVTPEQGWTVPNSEEFSGQIINDSMKHSTYDMTTAGIFARSYNTGTVQVALTQDKETRHEYLERFGIGSAIGIGLPYAASGTLADWEDWDGRQQFTTTFGQGYSQTVLHTAQMTQAIANGGVMNSPRLIKALLDEDGTEHEVEPEEGTRVISEETAAEMLKLMEGVVDHGTAQPAQIAGYRVGGKTGTGQAAGVGGYDGHTTSFTMVAPLDDPEYIVTVSVYRPQGNWRDWKVTDTASQVMSYVLNKYNVPPNDAESESYDAFTEDPQKRAW
ncbi:peptidoglycan D,D-transpeptidase FtsI family protein [Citricoccus sp. NR2]|uniref:peptidoglycan D,D-transpeptidase FtsI family protein n=1 Tax=Citricoccus sp. NR2 TaxID=3004095 RepID=UPI0022DDC7E4|nr:penicillin-binding protein 2 [Citricoccus sp. NR2]WBL18109.1 penicillin-binding protein 2 [Citricoccus sp. NR2]